MFNDVLWKKETEFVIKCRQLSSMPLCESPIEALKPQIVFSAALRTRCRCTPAGKPATHATHAAHSFDLPGAVRQAHGSVHEIGRADFRGTLRMGLPDCSEQRTRNGTPQLGAGSPLGKREGCTLSDKEL